MKILVIIVRGLQPRMLGVYGNRWVETSFLNTLAAAGVVFDRHFSLHPDPVQTRRAWRSGCHQFSNSRASSLSAQDWLPILRERGIHGRLIQDVSRGEFPEFALGWSHVDQVEEASEVVRLARESLQSKQDSWLTWVELATLLPPWRIPEPIVQAYFETSTFSETETEFEEQDVNEEDDEDVGGDLIQQEPQLEPLFEPPTDRIDDKDDCLHLRLCETYAAAVSYVDGLLGQLLDGLEDDVHVILTSDAGYALGEHGFLGQRIPWLHEEIVSVPLIVYGPSCRAGRRVETLTGSIDLATTIANLGGIELKHAHGIGLLPLLGGPVPISRKCLAIGGHYDDRQLYSLRTTDGAALIAQSEDSREARLYVKPDDRNEINDVAHKDFEKLEWMEKILQFYLNEADKPGPLLVDPEEVMVSTAQSMNSPKT